MEQAPAFEVSEWLNTAAPLSLESFRGRVVAVFAFQMLCPGCAMHSIPQARNVHEMFPENDVAVIGLHTVFEHHAAMGVEALKAFIHEYKIPFPVAIDAPSGRADDPFPKTMTAYRMQGTPTLLLFDREGRLRKNKFGHEHDLVLGAELMLLMKGGAPL